MKRLFITIVLLIACYVSSYALRVADTTAIKMDNNIQWVTDTTTSSKGKPVVKYYCIYKNELYSTTKNTYHKIMLSKKFNAICKLIMVTYSNGRKVIVTN